MPTQPHFSSGFFFFSAASHMTLYTLGQEMNLHVLPEKNRNRPETPLPNLPVG